MNRTLKWIPAVGALAFSFLLGSCDSLNQSTQPELIAGSTVAASTSGTSYVIAEETDPVAGSVTAQIGKAGGKLILGPHTLVVSKNAVSRTTTFTMTRDAEAPLRVHLTAGRLSQNDVGAAGFAAPVRLSLNYAKAEALPQDESSITMVYYRPDGQLEPLPTIVGLDPVLADALGVPGSDDIATAELPHFSLFGIAWP